MSTPFLDAVNAIGSVARLYRMNETTGTAMIDSTANDADGVYTGATINQDPLSLDDAARSVLFDGVDDVASQDPDGQLGGNLQPPVSIAAIVRTTEESGRVIANWGRAGVRYGFFIGIETGGQAWAGGTSTAVNTEIVRAASEAVVNDGEPHLIVGVFDDASTQRVYVDNHAAVSGSETMFANNNNSEQRRLSVGVPIASHTGFSVTDKYDGRLEYVVLFNKIVSAAEVLTLYNALLPWARLTIDTVGVADEPGGTPENSAQLFDEAEVFHPTSSNLTASLTISNTAVADIDSALPSGWTDAGSGVYTATARTPAQMSDDLQALSVAGALIGSTTATLVLTDTGAVTSTAVVTLTCVDTDFSVVIADGGTFDFGSSPLDTPKSAQFRFVNEGSANWVIDASGATVTGTGFSLDATDDPSDTTVTPGNETTVTVIFEPTTTGAKTGALNIAGDQDGSPYIVNLEGQGGVLVDGTGQGEADGTIRMIFTRASGLWGDTITVDNSKITAISQVTGGTRSFTVGSVIGAGGGTLQVIITPSPLIYSTASGGALTVTIDKGWLTDENGDTTEAFSGIADDDNSSTQEPDTGYALAGEINAAGQLELSSTRDDDTLWSQDTVIALAIATGATLTLDGEPVDVVSVASTNIPAIPAGDIGATVTAAFNLSPRINAGEGPVVLTIDSGLFDDDTNGESGSLTTETLDNGSVQPAVEPRGGGSQARNKMESKAQPGKSSVSLGRGSSPTGSANG